jgi:fluoroquinolone transport system ATP-binding protein
VRDDVIEIEGLCFRYPGAAEDTLRDVTLTVGRGEVFGLLGPSGAGKSTLQKVLTRQQRRWAKGRVEVFGRGLEAWGQDYFERIGVGFELPNHFPRLTALENLRFFASLYPGATRDPHELLASVGLAHAADVRVSEFSKGMAMRLNFVRALLHGPELLFLDEPTSGLDPVNARVVKDAIVALAGAGSTVVLTTHDMTTVDELCARVAFMVRGEVAALDHCAALKARHGVREVVMAWRDETGRHTDVFRLDGLGDDPRFLDRLRAGGIETIHSREATLDRVFAAVTGTELASEPASSAGGSGGTPGSRGKRASGVASGVDSSVAASGGGAP